MLPSVRQLAARLESGERERARKAAAPPCLLRMEWIRGEGHQHSGPILLPPSLSLLHWNCVCCFSSGQGSLSFFLLLLLLLPRLLYTNHSTSPPAFYPPFLYVSPHFTPLRSWLLLLSQRRIVVCCLYSFVVYCSARRTSHLLLLKITNNNVYDDKKGKKERREIHTVLHPEPIRIQ